MHDASVNEIIPDYVGLRILILLQVGFYPGSAFPFCFCLIALQFLNFV